MSDMPRLSIIVPVYQVERYLVECLDSILGQDFSDFELIAVDDCSPDGSAEILRRYAQTDDRVRVLSLEQNVGLGAARNAGLEIARGEYVWFIDSDDVLCPNTLSLIMRRAEETRSEVVLFGWVRFYEDGREKWGGRADLLGRAPRTFTAAEWPPVMKVIQVAWNKIILRDLLERTGLRFPDGFYEDTAFTYPLLASACSISTVPKLVVRYRQRTGAITATRTHRHFEVFDQWQIAMTKLADVDANGRLRAELFPLMIRHCAHILMTGTRLPIEDHRDYIVRLRQLAKTHAPPGGYHAARWGDAAEVEIARAGSLVLLQLFWKIRSSWWAVSKLRRRQFGPLGRTNAEHSEPLPSTH
jgi:CDP-glycerol glycerophosphotransferase